jgi:hypothetical protein
MASQPDPDAGPSSASDATPSVSEDAREKLTGSGAGVPDQVGKADAAVGIAEQDEAGDGLGAFCDGPDASAMADFILRK